MQLTLYADVLFRQEYDALMANGDLTPEEREVMETALIEHQTASIDKVENLMKFTTDIVSFQAECKKEEDRIRDRRKEAERIESKIMNSVKGWMLAQGHEKVEAGSFKLSFRKSTGVVLDDIKAVPAEYKVVTISEDLDKNKVKEAMKKDPALVLPGCHLEERKNLTIK